LRILFLDIRTSIPRTRPELVTLMHAEETPSVAAAAVVWTSRRQAQHQGGLPTGMHLVLWASGSEGEW